MNVAFRLATAADLYYATATWMFSFRESKEAGLICDARWVECMEPEIRRILTAPEVDVHVLYNVDETPESKADIIGWIAVRKLEPSPPEPGPRRSVVVQRPVVYFCHVKGHFHGWGFARALFRRVRIDPWTDEFDYVCRTRMMFSASGGRQPIVKRMARARWEPSHARKDEHGKERRRQGGEGGKELPPGAGGAAGPGAL